jgi:hypothetical protein
MGSTPSDLPTVAIAVTFIVALAVATLCLCRWHPSHSSPLRFLTGTRAQQAALVQALRPVIKEFVPHLGAAGIEVRSIALLPALAGTAGEPLQAQVEQADGTHSFTIRLACSVGGILRRPEDIAGALADELLELHRSAGGVTIVRQTPAVVVPVVNATQNGSVNRPVGRNGLATLPRIAAQNEAEGTVIPFKPSPLGRNGDLSS